VPICSEAEKYLFAVVEGGFPGLEWKRGEIGGGGRCYDYDVYDFFDVSITGHIILLDWQWT
jgi:hypothetical protein